MNQKICDLCKMPISQIDRVYFVAYGEVSKIPLIKGNSKKGEVCYSCCKKIEQAIENLKSK